MATPWAGPDPIESAWDAAARTVYRNLLELLDITISVDVLSGTSAGGVNAALLGMSSGVDLAGLRDLWLTTGSMDILLRDPAGKNPPSLMQGDNVLYRQLAAEYVISTMRACSAGHPQEARATTVYITTTMMSGGPAGSLTTTARWCRTFPAAFEPSFVPVGEILERGPGGRLPSHLSRQSPEPAVT